MYGIFYFLEKKIITNFSLHCVVQRASLNFRSSKPTLSPLTLSGADLTSLMTRP